MDISPIRVDLLDMSKDEICYSMSRFVCEIKKKNGEEYPAETLYELVISIQLYLEMHGRELKLLDDPAFSQLAHTLDNTMKERTRAGFRVKRRQAQPISFDEEDTMWKSSVLGTDTPQKLFDTLLYMLGLNFALRAAQEHRNLRWGTATCPSQLEIYTKDGKRFLRYTEDTSKTRQGGLHQRKIAPKTVSAIENTVKPERCIVRLYEKYLSHCPSVHTDAFYLRPLKEPKGNVWFSKQPVGVNTLSMVVKRLCHAAGLGGHRTNHSLRASAATRLYNCQFDEQVIAETTGHRSNSIRQYKRTSDDLKEQASLALQGITPGIRKKVCTRSGPAATSTCTYAEPDSNVTVNVNVTLQHHRA